jgi:hypothetical protein
MDFTYTTPDNSTQSVRVPFDPPLMGYEEVKPRMLSMKVDAEEALGMVRHSPILISPLLTCFPPL